MQSHNVLISPSLPKGLCFAPSSFRIALRRGLPDQRQRNLSRKHCVISQVGTLTIPFTEKSADPVPPGENRPNLKDVVLRAGHCTLLSLAWVSKSKPSSLAQN